MKKMFRRFPLSAFALTTCLLMAGGFSPAPAQNPAETDSLGVVRPNYSVEPTVIAVAPFGRSNNAPVEIDTLPRIIRRDLELSGFFTMPPDQRAVNRQNLKDVSTQRLDWSFWNGIGAQHYLMGQVEASGPDTMKASVLLYDVPSRQIVIRRDFEGPADEPRMLAHRISDEVVRFTKNTEGIAQTKLIYITEQIPGIKEVAITDADGFNQRPLTRYNNITTGPTWGANGAEFYYTSYAGNRANIMGQRLRDGSTWKIAAYGGTNHSPDWSPAAQRIVMTLSKDGNSELYTANRDGADLRRVTSTRATEGSPVWAPDGSRIAYVSNQGGGQSIWVSNPDGSNARRLVNKGGWIDSPAWSPDGTQIAFVYRAGGINDIYTVRANGDENTVRRLTMNQGNNESPAWAPNSRHIAFSSDRDGQWQIYMMLDDGSNQRVLTSSGRNKEPDWGPMPKVQ